MLLLILLMTLVSVILVISLFFFDISLIGSNGIFSILTVGSTMFND